MLAIRRLVGKVWYFWQHRVLIKLLWNNLLKRRFNCRSPIFPALSNLIRIRTLRRIEILLLSRKTVPLFDSLALINLFISSHSRWALKLQRVRIRFDRLKRILLLVRLLNDRRRLIHVHKVKLVLSALELVVMPDGPHPLLG